MSSPAALVSQDPDAPLTPQELVRRSGLLLATDGDGADEAPWPCLEFDCQSEQLPRTLGAPDFPLLDEASRDALVHLFYTERMLQAIDQVWPEKVFLRLGAPAREARDCFRFEGERRLCRGGAADRSLMEQCQRHPEASQGLVDLKTVAMQVVGISGRGNSSNSSVGGSVYDRLLRPAPTTAAAAAPTTVPTDGTTRTAAPADTGAAGAAPAPSAVTPKPLAEAAAPVAAARVAAAPATAPNAATAATTEAAPAAVAPERGARAPPDLPSPAAPSVPSVIDSTRGGGGGGRGSDPGGADDDVSEMETDLALSSPAKPTGGGDTIVTASPPAWDPPSGARRGSGRRKGSKAPAAAAEPTPPEPSPRSETPGPANAASAASGSDEALVLERTEDKIPVWKDVAPILKRFGYKVSAGKYCRPGCSPDGDPHGCFDTEPEFRRYLCLHGVEVGGSQLTEDEHILLVRYVRFAIVTAPEFTGMFPEMERLGISEVWKLLRKLGFKKDGLHEFVLPTSGTPITGVSAFLKLEGHGGLFGYLARHGFPTECSFNNISRLDRLRLEVYVALQPGIEDLTFMPSNMLPGSPLTSSGRTRHSIASIKRPEPHGGSESVQPSAQKRAKMAEKTPKSVKSSAKRTAAQKTPKSAKSTAKPKKARETPKMAEGSTGRRSKRQPAQASESGVDQSPTNSHSDPAMAISIPTSPVVAKATRRETSLVSPISSRVPLPDQKQTIGEKLEACLEVLKTSYQASAPVFDHGKMQDFTRNLLSVERFVQGVIDSEGGHAGTVGESASMYVCGGPGIGKTSGIKFVCQRVIETASIADDCRAPVFCYLNAVSISSSHDPLESLCQEMADSTGFHQSKTLSALKSQLTRSKKFILLVLDEIDALVADTNGGGQSKSERALAALLECAADDKYPLALIGISNTIGSDKYARLHSVGKFQHTVGFRRYSEADLQCIIRSRIGDRVVAPGLVELVAKKVAKASGDARAALDLVAEAVRFRWERLAALEAAAVPTHPHPLVALRDHVLAQKEAQDSLPGRIQQLPLYGRVVLCVLVALAEHQVVYAQVKELRECVAASLVDFPEEHRIMTPESFNDLLDMLVDWGVVKLDRVPPGAARESLAVAQFQLAQVRLGMQLQDVSEAVQKDMVEEKGFWAKIQHAAREHWRLTAGP